MFGLRDFESNYNCPAWFEAARAICDENGIDDALLERAGGSDHVVFFVGDDLVLKIYRPERNCYQRERAALEFAVGKTRFSTPKMVFYGNSDGLDHLMMTRVRGDEMTRPEFLAHSRNEQVGIVTELALGLRELHYHPAVGFESDWKEFVQDRAASFIERQIGHGVNKKIIEQLPAYIDESLSLVPLEPTVFLHGDVHFGNLRFRTGDIGPRPHGLFDFADSRVGWHEYDVLAIGVLILQGERELQREFFRAYGYADDEMDEEMRRRLMMLTMLYETSDLRRYAMRLRPDAVDLDLYGLEKAIWAFA